MPHHGKKDKDGAGDTDAIAAATETLADALSKVGSEPTSVGRKIVSQGKRRESLKKWTSKDAGK